MTVSLSPNINMRYKNADMQRINQVLSLLDNSFPYDIEIIGNMGYTDVISLLRGKDYQDLMNYVAIQDTFPSANFKKKESGGFQLMHKRLVTGAIDKTQISAFSSIKYVSKVFFIISIQYKPKLVV